MRAKNCRIEKLIRNCPKLSDSVQFGTLTESRYTPMLAHTSNVGHSIGAQDEDRRRHAVAIRCGQWGINSQRAIA